MSESLWRIAGWLIPIACMTSGSLATYTQYQRLETAKHGLERAEGELGLAEAAFTAAQKAKLETRYAAQPETLNEEAAFLRDLRKRAVESGVAIIKWTSSVTPAAPPATPSEKQKDAKPDPLQGIKRVSSDLTIEGPYPNMRTFAQGLLESDRLYTASNLRWARIDEGGTRMTVTIARYTASLPDPILVEQAAAIGDLK